MGDVEAQPLHALDHRGGRCRAGDEAADLVVDAALQFARRVDQHVVDDRRAAHVRDAVLPRSPRRSPARRPSAGRRWCRRSPPSSRGSTSRCNGTSAASTDRPGAAASPQATMLRQRVEVGAAMVVDHALGVAGGARGVVERDRVPLVGGSGPGEVGIAFRRGTPRSPSRRAACRPSCRGSSMSITSGRRSSNASAARSCRELAVGDQDLGLAMLEQEGDRLGVEASVQRVQHGADHRHGEMRLVHRGNVRRHHGDGIARGRRRRAQRRGEAAGAGIGLRPGAALLAVDDGDPVWVALPPPWAGSPVARAAHSSPRSCPSRRCTGRPSWRWLVTRAWSFSRLCRDPAQAAGDGQAGAPIVLSSPG